MRSRSLLAIAFLMCIVLGVGRSAVADTHDLDPSHHDTVPHDPPHHDLVPHDPPHHDAVPHDMPHHDPDPHNPHHHAGDPHSLGSSLHLVDSNDLLLWQTSFGTNHFATHSQGDLNGDFAIDGEDFLRVQRNLGAAILVSPTAASVPEPSSLILVLSSIGFALAKRRRRAK